MSGANLREKSLVELGLSQHEALRALECTKVADASSNEQKKLVWRRVSKEVLQPSHPFKLHQLLLNAVYQGWDAQTQGPIPVWIPTPEGIRDTNLANFMASFQGSKEWSQKLVGDPVHDYPLLQRISCTEPEVFWPQVFAHMRIQYEQQPQRVYQPAADPDQARWLPGARLNIGACALGCRDPDAPALLWAEEEAPTAVHTVSLGQLKRQSEQVAAALRARKIQPGAAVAICMPMTASSVAIYLGIVLAGCAVVGIADSFAPAEIGSRLRIAEAALLFTQDVIHRDGKTLPLFDRACKASHVPAVVLPARGHSLQALLRPGDTSWEDFVASGQDTAGFRAHPAEADASTNILFSSGTTGEPKAIPWTHVTPLRAATDAWAQLDVRPGDVVAWPTNLGWMMGPFLIYASLLNGAAMALFHGAPLGRPFGQFVASARVTMLGLVPSIVKAWRRTGCTQGLDWSCVRCFASTGEASAPEDYHWLTAQAGYKPVLELCGGTELGGAFISGSLLQPQAPSTFSTPTLGSQLVLLVGEETVTQNAHESGKAVTGELALVPPFLGGSQRLLNADHHKVYFKGMPTDAGSRLPLRRHGDVFERLPNGYYIAHGRSDDTMNLGGIKVSSVELERTCMKSVPAVLEAAAVAVPEDGGGPDRLVLFAVLRNEAEDLTAVQLACQAAIRSNINPLFKLHQVIACASLPRTASNKVMRRVLRTQLMTKPKL